eukprot:824268-Amphidinium_carterae.1
MGLCCEVEANELTIVASAATAGDMQAQSKHRQYCFNRNANIFWASKFQGTGPGSIDRIDKRDTCHMIFGQLCFNAFRRCSGHLCAARVVSR